MSDPRDAVPGYQLIWMRAPQAPVAARADAEAWQARGSYPDLCFAGPVFGVAREREQGGWELLPYFSGFTPQEARDGMGPVFRRLAAEAEQAGNPAAQEECGRAASRMDWEALDELAVLGARYRVVRAEQFVRTGPAGPEGPRPTDPDPGEPGGAHEIPDPAAGFVMDPATATGMSEGILRAELLGCVYPEGVVPAYARDDSARACQAYPGGVLLPGAFVTAEEIGGRWVPEGVLAAATPQAARDGLALYLRVTAPWKLSLGPGERAVYAAAADRLDAERADEVLVAGRRFRVVRAERLVRFGPDGPEGARPSDPDPQPPVMVQASQLPGAGQLASDGDAGPVEPDEDARRVGQLFRAEEERRKRLEKR